MYSLLKVSKPLLDSWCGTSFHRHRACFQWEAVQSPPEAAAFPADSQYISTAPDMVWSIFPSSSHVFSICSIFPLTENHYRSVDYDIAVTHFQHFLCGEHLVPKQTKCYFSDGCGRMSGFNPPVRAAYFLSFIPMHRRRMLPGSHGIAVPSAWL